MSGKPEVVYLIEETSVPTLNDMVSALLLHNSFCDNLLRLLGSEMHDEGVRRKVLAHGIRHLKRIGVNATRYLNTQKK